MIPFQTNIFLWRQDFSTTFDRSFAPMCKKIVTCKLNIHLLIIPHLGFNLMAVRVPLILDPELFVLYCTYVVELIEAIALELI